MASGVLDSSLQNASAANQVANARQQQSAANTAKQPASNASSGSKKEKNPSDDIKMTREQAVQIVGTLAAAYEVEQKGGDPTKGMNESMKQAYYAYKKNYKSNDNSALGDLWNCIKGEYGLNGVLQTVGGKGLDMLSSSIGGVPGMILAFMNRTGIANQLMERYTGASEAEMVVERAMSLAGSSNSATNANAQTAQANAAQGNAKGANAQAAAQAQSSGTNARLAAAEQEGQQPQLSPQTMAGLGRC